MLPLLLLLPALAQDDDPWGLIRVDDPSAAGALASSHRGAVLLEPPEDGQWRVEPVPELHQLVGDYEASEAVDAMNLQPWHEAGYQGQGVKIAVFDLQWFGSALESEELGEFQSWDCWAHSACTPEIDTLRPRFSYERGSHGLACAEVVRDLAPQAELHLVRVNGLTTFENAAQWAIRNDIDIITLSMSFMNDSFYDGSGPVADAVEELSEGGPLLVTSAGNYARGHYQARFTDQDGDGRHDFDGDQRLPVYFKAGSKRLAVHWDNYYRCGDTDLDLYLYDEAGDLLSRATRAQSGKGCSPVERLYLTLDEAQWTWLEVVRSSGDPAVDWNLITTNGQVDGSMARGSVTDPGTHPLAWTVGAVEGSGYLANGPEGFSSQGPNQAGDPKPDIVAPDGLSSSVYGVAGFYGTSAASPAAAAALAVVMSRDRSLSARDAAALVEGWAVRDVETWQEADNAVGAGHLRLPDPEAELPGCLGRGLPWSALLLLPLGILRRKRVRGAAC